jgi:ribosomal-protein-alanine N-acetyltransferase
MAFFDLVPAPPMIPISDGFYLSRIVRTDKTAYLEHLVDPEIARNTLRIPFPYTEADADWWLDQCEKQAGEPEKMFAIRNPADYLIGAIGIMGNLPATTQEAEFGYWLAKPYRGRSLMARAILVFAKHAFEQLGLDRLLAKPFAFNIASQRTLEKSGFHREEVIPRHFLKNDVYLDAVVYGITFAQFLSHNR